jgi:hypothetical protein
MEEEFPSGDPGIPPWEVVAKAKKGPRRIFFLLHGVPAKEKEIPNIGNTNKY